MKTIVCFFVLLLAACPVAEPKENTTPSQIVDSLGKLPLQFIKRQDVFFVQGADKTVYFSSQGLTFALKGKSKRWIMKLDFIDPYPNTPPIGQNKQKTKVSYFKGAKESWKTGLSAYSKLAYRDLWPGVDLIYSGENEKLKYQFVVKPGADPKNIKLRYRGVSGLRVKDNNRLEIVTPEGSFEDEAPYAYQDINGERKTVSMKYEVQEGHVLAFNLGEYDPKVSLVLDPAFVILCGYIGGHGDENYSDIILDKQGDIYLCGTTTSTESSLPVTVGPDLTYNGSDCDTFVAKINSSNYTFEYLGYIGGNSNDFSKNITVDSKGRAIVFGNTTSDESSFPVKFGPDLTYNGGGSDCFIACVNAQGTGLDYCGYLGGGDWDLAEDCIVDDKDFLYMTGGTYSSQSTFPVKVGPDLVYDDEYDAFVAKLQPDGSSLVYCGYIGGESSDYGYALSVDDSGNLYVAGSVGSDEKTFPIAVGPDLTFNGSLHYDLDSFIAKVDPTGTNLLYCGYLGGDEWDVIFDMAIDEFGAAYVVGYTLSNEHTFPILKGPGLYFRDDTQQRTGAFVARVNPTGASLDFCGYINGQDTDFATSVALDQDRNAYVVGVTSSKETSFPVKRGPDLTHNGHRDAFIAKVNAQDFSLDYCGYLGGADSEWVWSINRTKEGAFYLSGATTSDEQTFPVKGPLDNTFNGYGPDGWGDVFVAKLEDMPLITDMVALSASSGGTVNFAMDCKKVNANRNYLIFGGYTGVDPGTPLPGGYVAMPINWDQFTNLTLMFANTPIFQNFMGTLDQNGMGNASLNVGPMPGAVGFVMHFSFALNNPWDYASDPVSITIVP